MGCKFSPSPKGEGLFPYFRREDGTNEENRFYIIQDRFFEDMTDPYLKGNKADNRPHYYCFEDTSTGVYWIIVEESVFLIQDMFPITEEYIEREYTISQNTKSGIFEYEENIKSFGETQREIRFVAEHMDTKPLE